MKRERRQSIRHVPPRNDLYVFSPLANVTAKVVDISKGGLKFEYHSMILNKKEEWCTVDIFMGGHNRVLYIPAVASRIIYDISSLSEGGAFTGSPKRISGLKHLELTEEQEKKLEYLIEQEMVNPRMEPV